MNQQDFYIGTQKLLPSGEIKKLPEIQKVLDRLAFFAPLKKLPEPIIIDISMAYFLDSQ